MKPTLFIVLAIACFLASLGGGGFYYSGVLEQNRLIQDAERRIPEAESKIQRLGDAPPAFDEKAGNSQQYAFEDALREMKFATEAVVQARRFRSESQLAFVGAALGPLAIGALLLFLGLRARREAQLQLSQLGGAAAGGPATQKALWPLPLGIVVAGVGLVGILFVTSSGSSKPEGTPASAPKTSEPTRPSAAQPNPAPSPVSAPENRATGTATVSAPNPVAPPVAPPGGAGKPPAPTKPASPASPGRPTAPGADPFQ